MEEVQAVLIPSTDIVPRRSIRVFIFRILNSIFCMHYALEEVVISSLSLPLDQGVIPGFAYKKERRRKIRDETELCTYIRTCTPQQRENKTYFIIISLFSPLPRPHPPFSIPLPTVPISLRPRLSYWNYIALKGEKEKKRIKKNPLFYCFFFQREGRDSG